MTALPPEHRITPLFIGGSPRSGTTLLANLLGQRLKKSIVTPESQFKFEILQVAGANKETYDPPALVELIRSHPRFTIWGYDWRPALGEGKFESAAPGRLLENLVIGYGGDVAEDPVYWIDHTPQNLRYAKALEAAFPAAYFIHLLRDGRAVARSVLPLDWGPNTIRGAAQWWQRHVGFGLAAEAGGGVSAPVVEVRYEDLVSSPHEVLELIVDELGLHDLPGSRLEDGSSSVFQVPEYTRQQHQLVGLDPDPARINAWKSELREREVEVFEYYAGEMLELLGYTRSAGSMARSPSKAAQALSYVKELLHRPINYYRRKRRFNRSL